MKELSNNKVMVFGDSVSKGVVYDGRELSVLDNGVVKEVTDHYRVEFKNISVYGQTLKRLYDRRIIDKHLKEMSDEDAALTYVVLVIGGNDCDYDWKAISADPDGEHLPHTPSERFIDGYCTAIRKARQAGARVAMTSLPPLEQSRYFSFITKGLSAENILRWLGDTDHLYRWQEYYNDMVTQLSRAFGCRLVDLRAEFLKSRVFPSLIGADGIHPTQAGHDLIHQSVQTALSY